MFDRKLIFFLGEKIIIDIVNLKKQKQFMSPYSF